MSVQRIRSFVRHDQLCRVGARQCACSGAASGACERFARLVCAATLLVLLSAGCGKSAEIREYVVDAENERIFTSDLLKNEFSSIPFGWQVPGEWSLAANDQFSKVAWEIGPTEEQARITLSELPIEAGLVPQLVRWRGQLKIQLDPKDDPMQGTETLKLDGTSGTYVDFKGTEETFLGLLLPVGDKLWIFKYRSSNAMADQQRKQFREFCESVKILK
ncbi:MAG: hypothetical protein WAO83_08370 [Fuerstiella sp.]